ncbi:MAG: hypothetical protein PF517_15110 [Salinivirgaceae bacterium]|jgi:hypothetical protein|nr:hypothetical protein [Salinivirgaceae bacterium]
MKKSIYIFGMVCLSIILMGTIFKASHLPGASILITIGLSSIAFLFLPFALGLLLKASDDKSLKFVYYAAFISFSVDFTGMLFKILHWPGAEWLMVIGIPLPFVLFLPAYISYHNKRKLKTDMSFFGIILFMIYLGVFSTLLALNASYTVFKSYAHSASSISETNSFLSYDLKQGEKTRSSASSLQLVKQIETLKQQLAISANTENSQFIYPDGSFSYETIYSKDKVLNLEQYNLAGLNDLNKELVIYYNTLNKLKKNNECIRLFEEIEAYRIPKYEADEPLLTKLPLITALNVLTDWQNKILLIEYYKTHI